VGLKDLEAEIKKPAFQDSAVLAKWLVESLDELSEMEIEGMCAEEGERRLNEVEQGLMPEVPAEEVIRRARAAIS
jgi:hypothetical protein